MKKQLTYIAPLKAGIIFGILYGILALILVPFFLVAALLGGKTGNPLPAVFGAGFAIMLPVIYAVMGFIGGIIVAALYNLVAKWTGGFEVEVRDLAPLA
jgi:hypothetical protein